MKVLPYLMILPLLLFCGCDDEEDDIVESGLTVSIIDPVTGMTLAGVIDVHAYGVDRNGNPLDRFVYYIDEEAIYVDTEPGTEYPASEWSWDSEAAVDGVHEIRVVGYDNAGRWGEDNVRISISNVDQASGVVRSNQTGVIRAPYGAQITVPLGAVPLTEDGSTGAMVFSIERVTEEVQVTNTPVGMIPVGYAYQLGPDGFIFNTPVEVALPVPDSYRIGELQLARIDPTSHRLTWMSADYDPGENLIKAMTSEMSIWQVWRNEEQSAYRAYGWLELTNHVDDYYVIVCAQNYNPLYSDDTDFQGIRSVLGPGNWLGLSTGWDNTVQWSLPQGSYALCFEFVNVHDPADRSRSAGPQVTIQNNDGWVQTLSERTMSEYDVRSQHFSGAQTGSCSCTLEPTPSAGTGDIQVTLTWYNEQSIDLDLWIYEPSGERCYFAHAVTTTGGELDRDNLCGNYENGHPENIFWREDPPMGDYSVWVHWWSDCGNGMSAQNFNVRIVTTDHVVTIDSTVTRDDTVKVAEFTIAAGGFSGRQPGWTTEGLSRIFEDEGYSRAELEAIKQSSAAVRRR